MEALRKHRHTKQLVSRLLQEGADQICEELAGLIGHQRVKEHVNAAMVRALEEGNFTLAEALRSRCDIRMMAGCDLDEHIERFAEQAKDEAIKFLIEVLIQNGAGSEYNLRTAVAVAIKHNRSGLAEWVREKIKTPLTNPFEVYILPQYLADTEKAFELLKWGKLVGGELKPVKLLISVAETGRKDLMIKMEEEVGSIKNVGITKLVYIVIAALKSNNKEFADWVMTRAKIRLGDVLESAIPYSQKQVLIRKIYANYYTELLEIKDEISTTVITLLTHEIFFYSDNLKAARACYEKTGQNFWELITRYSDFDKFKWSRGIAFWALDTFKFSLKARILIEIARKQAGAEEAELFIQKILEIEPEAIKLLRDEIIENLGDLNLGLDVSEWMLDRFNVTKLGIHWVSAVERILDYDTNNEKLKWILERFKPEKIEEEAIDNIYWLAVTLSPEELELIYSAGLRPSNPYIFIEDISDGEIKLESLDWVVEKFSIRTTCTLSQDQLETALEYSSDAHFRWLLQWYLPSINHHYLEIALNMDCFDKAVALAEHYSSQTENGKDKYQLFIEACKAADRDAALNICQNL